MFKKILLASALASAVCVGSVANAAEKNLSVGAINLPYIMSEIPQSKAMQETLVKEFGPREKELEKLQQDGMKLQQDIGANKFSGDELVTKQRELARLQSDFQLKARALQEDQQKRFQEEQRDITIVVQQAIDDIAKERGLDIVLRGESIAYINSDLDLTQDVIKRVSAAAKNTKSKKK